MLLRSFINDLLALALALIGPKRKSTPKEEISGFAVSTVNLV
jgi:hypothetical protein